MVFAWLAFISPQLFAQLAPPTRDPIRQGDRPNIILIVANGLGWGDLGSYGQSHFTTPNLDRMAAEGMRFSQAYAGGTVDVASWCSLMTGQHTGNTRVRSSHQIPLEPTDITLAEVLRTADYPSAAIGSWGLGWEGTSGHPLRQGFTEFFGFLERQDSNNYFPTRLWRNEEHFVLEGNLSGLQRAYAPDWFVRTATNSMRLWQSRPFFLYVSMPLPQANAQLGTNGMQVPSLGRHQHQTWPPQEKAKAAMIEYLDHCVGLLVGAVQHMKLDLDTLILFTSTTGPHADAGIDPAHFKSAGPFRGQQGTLLEGGLRVPLIARWPGRIRPGSIQDLPIAAWDILPTVAEIARASRPRQSNGISFLPTLLSREQKHRHEYLYWESRDEDEAYSQAIRLDKWKAIRVFDGDAAAMPSTIELYDLESDPGETEDVAGAHPDVVSKIKEHFEAKVQPWDEPTVTAPRPFWFPSKAP